MAQQEFRFRKRRYIHEDKVLKTTTDLQIKKYKGGEYWETIPEFDEVVELRNPKDVDYY